MNRKVLVLALVVVAIVVVGVPLYAGGAKEGQAAEVVTGEPQYGGTITVVNYLTDSLGVPDPAFGTGFTNIRNIVGERILVGDIHQYGIRGSDEWGFTDDAGLPLAFTKGGVIESWEVTADRLTFRVRDGIMWSGKSINDVMDARPVVADDIVHHYRRVFDPASGAGGYIRGIEWIKAPEVESVYALDDRTVVIETNYYHGTWDSTLTGGGGQLFAPESYEVADDGVLRWENMVGTGPFVISDYEPGSQITFERNPHYWQKAIIDGQEYDTPFVDRLVYPFIRDESTAVAALQTATLDAFLRVSAPQIRGIEARSSRLQSRDSLSGLAMTLFFDLRNAPFNNRDVRRALMIGTDRESINAMQMSPDLEYNMSPFAYGWDGWVAVEDMPESTRKLYTFDPELAKQMLADAGYPNGFTMDILTTPNRNADMVTEMVADQWSEYGIRVNITSIEEATLRRQVRPPAQMGQDAVLETIVTHTPINFAFLYFGTDQSRNAGRYSSEYFDTRMRAAMGEVDDENRARLLKEANLHILDDVAVIPFAVPPMRSFWWPWLENIHGEVWYQIHTPDYHNWWLNQERKSSMGY